MIINHPDVTQRNLKNHPLRFKLQILLGLLLISFLAVPGLAQVTSGIKDQAENSSMSDESQAQVQRKTQLAINLEKIRFEEQGKDKDQPQTTSTSYLFTKPKAAKASAAMQPDPDLSNFAVFFDAGAAVPHGDLSFFLDPGFSLNAGLEYMFTSQFSAEGTFGYHRFSTFFGDDANLYQLSVNGKFYFVDDSNKVRPFVNGGIGAYVTDSATTHFGGNIGAGILFEVTPHFGIQGKYNFHVFNLGGDGARFSTVQGGVRFRF